MTTLYRLRPNVGKHIENDAAGKEQVIVPGQTFESTNDRLDADIPEKVERVVVHYPPAAAPQPVPFSQPVVPAALVQAAPGVVAAGKPKSIEETYGPFDHKNVKELQGIAETEEVDLRGATHKEAIIKVLRAAK